MWSDGYALGAFLAMFSLWAVQCLFCDFKQHYDFCKHFVFMDITESNLYFEAYKVITRRKHYVIAVESWLSLIDGLLKQISLIFGMS